MKVQGVLGGQAVTILIDGGSNYSYVRFEVARRAEVAWYSDVDLETVTMANGQLEHAEICHIEGRIEFQGYGDVVHLNVVDALICDIILGQD